MEHIPTANTRKLFEFKVLKENFTNWTNVKTFAFLTGFLSLKRMLVKEVSSVVGLLHCYMTDVGGGQRLFKVLPCRCQVPFLLLVVVKERFFQVLQLMWKQ